MVGVKKEVRRTQLDRDRKAWSNTIQLGIVFLIAWLLVGCAMPSGGYLLGLETAPLTERSPSETTPGESSVNGTPVYTADECTGAIVNGVCHGSVIPDKAHREKCYGEMLFGKCTGPQF